MKKIEQFLQRMKLKNQLYNEANRGYPFSWKMVLAELLKTIPPFLSYLLFGCWFSTMVLHSDFNIVPEQGWITLIGITILAISNIITTTK